MTKKPVIYQAENGAIELAVDNVKLLAKNKIDNDDVLELVKTFADTWFNLEAFDENKLPQVGLNKIQINLQVDS